MSDHPEERTDDEPQDGDVVIELVDGVPVMTIHGEDRYNFKAQEEELIRQAQEALDEDEEPYEIKF